MPSWTPERRVLAILNGLDAAESHLGWLAREAPWAKQVVNKVHHQVEVAQQMAGRDLAREMNLPASHFASTTRVAYRHLEKMAYRDKVALRIKQFQSMMNLGKRFGVLSAYGAGSKKENQIRHGKLVAELQRRGYRKMTPLKGKWEGVAEKSILVPQIKFSDLVDLGRMFDQISVIYKSDKNVLGMYYLREGTAEVAAEATGEMAADIAADPSFWSKARGVSFEFGFLWGEKVPWNGRSPLTVADVEAVLRAQAGPVPES